MATVSIIMPVRNGEAFLGQAIASVSRQTLTHWELLIVDDGSSDASAAIAARAEAADPRIRVLQSEHRGAGAARNHGLRAATGEFVAFLDADDLYEEDKLAFEVAVLADHPTAAMTYGPTFWWFDGVPGKSWTESMGALANRLHAPPDLLRRVILNQESQVPCTCAVLIRRSAAEEAGGFLETLSLYEDQTLWVKLMLRHPIYVHDRVLCCYRQHAQSASAHAQAAGEYDRMRPHPARIAFLEWVEQQAAEAPENSALQRSLRLAFAPYGEHRRPLSTADRMVLAWRRVKARATRIGRRLRRLSGGSS